MEAMQDEVANLIDKAKSLIDQLAEAKAEARKYRNLYYEADEAISRIEFALDNPNSDYRARVRNANNIITEYAQ